MLYRKTIAASLGVLASVACIDSGGPNSGDSSDPVDVSIDITVDLSSFSSVEQIVVEVNADDLPTNLVFNLTVDDGVASGTLVIPAGAARTVTVIAFDGLGIETHRGSVTLDIQVGANPTLVISLTPQLGELPIEVYLGSFEIEVTPDSRELVAGDTVRLVAVVTDSQGDTLDVGALWATLDPGVATVDTLGLVTARGSGVTTIVASYAGVADGARITVGTAVPGGAWWPMAPMLEVRRNFATALVGDTIFVFGGFGKNEVEAYSIGADTWSSRTPMPTARGETGAVVLNGMVYVVGGSFESGAGLATVEVYDPATGSWSTGVPMPTARRGAAVALVNNVIYAIGGVGAGTTVEAFDPVAGTWSARAAAPVGVAHAAATSIAGVIYVTGGDGSGPRGGGPVVQAYDAATDTWTTRSPMLYNHDFHAAAAFAGDVFVAGGGPSRTETEFYDPATNGWTAGPAMLNARVHNGLVTANGAVYVMGGYMDVTGVLGSMDRLSP